MLTGPSGHGEGANREDHLRSQGRCPEHYFSRDYRHHETSGGGIAADYDAQGRLAGIEILDALKRFGDAETLRHVVLEGVGSAAFGK
jgi:hypothetical protein